MLEDSAASMSLSQAGSGQERTAPKKKKRKIENFASVSSSIMLKLPTKNLGSLRAQFMTKPDGLNLTEFLEAVINNMELPDVGNLMLMISDLTDFFQLVDINGDGAMEWEEFVMFILDAVVPNKEGGLQEMFEPAGSILLQPPSSREVVHVVKMIPALNKVVVGMGATLQFYEANEYATGLSTMVHKFRVIDEGASDGAPATIIDVTYVQSQDIVAVVRDNLTACFYKLRAPTNINADTIISLGTHHFGQPYAKLVFRDIAGLEARVFGIHNSSTVDSYKCNFSKYKKPDFTSPKPLSKHKDYVRDILLISTQQFKYVCSAGLDKTVQFWDLEDLRYKFARTGHRSGVQCLAFDGGRLLLGGGFDYTIIGWDLFNTLDQPAMVLSGHKSPVYRIVPIGPNERCCSLDEDGMLCWWDSSLTTPSDDARLITSTKASEDRIRDFDLYLNCGVNYNTQHGCVVVAAGRKQLTYRISDFSPNESAPLAVLYSKTLLALVTVHVTDVIFWSVVSADRHKTLNNIFGSESHTRVCSACLDDRGRKLYIGDSDGYIGVYNCLNGLKLKSIFVMPNAAIKNIIYTAEKYLIAIAGSSDLLVVDEYYAPPPLDISNPSGRRKRDEEDKEPVTNAAEAVLRQVVAHEAECRAMAFCAELGLIATVDIFGEIVVWDYQHFTVKFIFKDCADGSDVGEMIFLHPFPLLMVAANSGELVLLNLADQPQRFGPGDRIYRVQQHLSRRRRYSAEDEEDIMTALNRMETQFSSVFVDNSAGADENSSDDEAEPELTGSRAKAFDRKRIARYKKKRNREVNSLVFCIQEAEEDVADFTISGSFIETIVPNISALYPSVDISQQPETPSHALRAPPPHEPPPSTPKPKSGVIEDPFAMEVMLDLEGEERSKKLPSEAACAEIAPDGSILISGKEEVKKVQVAAYVDRRRAELELERKKRPDSGENRPLVTLQSMEITAEAPRPGVGNRALRLVLGHNDGTLSVLDITETLKAMNATEIVEADDVTKDPKYNASRRILKGPYRDGDEKAKTWPEDYIRAKEKIVLADFVTVWRPHDASISQIQVIGDYDYIVTASEDASVYLWTMAAAFRGTLTRGRDFDRVFRRTWDAPVDLEARDIRRAIEAEKLLRDHNLLQDEDSVSLASLETGEVVETSFIRLSRTPTASGSAARSRIIPVTSPSAANSTNLDGSTSLVSFVDNGHTWQSIDGSPKRFAEKVLEMTIEGIPTEEHLRELSKNALSIVNRERLIMQLEGAMTYQPSKKEFSQLIVGDRTQALVENIINEGEGTAMKMTKKAIATAVTSGVSKTRAVVTEDSMSDAKYYETIDAADEILATRAVSKVNTKMKRWEHEQEMADIDAKDPDNWDLKSYNRKREMYAHWFTEMTKGGVINDRMNVIKAKLNTLTPTGNFQEYAAALAHQKKLERDLFQKKQHERALKKLADMVSVHSSQGHREDKFANTKSIEFNDPAHKTAFRLHQEDHDDDEEVDEFNSMPLSMSAPQLHVGYVGGGGDATKRKASSSLRVDKTSPGRKASISARKSSVVGIRKQSMSRKQSTSSRKASIQRSSQQDGVDEEEIDSDRIKRLREEEMRSSSYNIDLSGKKYSVAYVRKKSEQVVRAHVLKVEKKVAHLGHIGDVPSFTPLVVAPPVKKNGALDPPDTEESLQWRNDIWQAKAVRISTAPDAAIKTELDSVAPRGLVKYASVGNIRFSNDDVEPADISKGRYDRNSGFVDLSDLRIRQSLPRIRSGTAAVVNKKDNWKLTSILGVEAGFMIGTRATTPKTIDPVVLNNERLAQAAEDEFARSILSSPLRSATRSPGGSDDDSMDWRPRSRASSPGSPSSPHARPFTPPVIHALTQISVPFNSSLAVAAASSTMCESPSKSSVKESPVKFDIFKSTSNIFSRNNSSFVQLVTPEEARLITEEVTKKFESVVKPITDKQYKKLLDAAADFDDSATDKKKKKRKRRKRKSSEVSVVPRDATLRLKPIDIDAIKALKPKQDVESVRSPYGRSRNSIIASMMQDALSPIAEHQNKAQQAEEAWMRKVQYALSDDKQSTMSKRLSAMSSTISDTKVKFSKLSSTVGAAQDSREADNDKRILARVSFGTVKAEDLLKLRDAFTEVAREAAAREAKDTIDLTTLDTADWPAALIEGRFHFDAPMQVNIHDFLICPYMLKKKSFAKNLKAYVQNLELRGKLKVNADMKTLMKQFFPLMPDSDRRDCVRYFVLKENSKVDKDKKRPPLGEEELAHLRSMFDYFDRDRGGTVDPKEIMEMLNMGKQKKLSVMDAEFSIAEKDVEATNVVDLINSVDQDDNAELDFEEFCELFRGCF